MIFVYIFDVVAVGMVQVERTWMIDWRITLWNTPSIIWRTQANRLRTSPVSCALYTTSRENWNWNRKFLATSL